MASELGLQRRENEEAAEVPRRHRRRAETRLDDASTSTGPRNRQGTRLCKSRNLLQILWAVCVRR